MHLRFSTCSVFLAAALCAQPGRIQTLVRPLVIRHVSVFDGTRLLHNQTVLSRGENIVELGPNVKIPEGANTIDGSGKTLLPGLIDARTRTTGGDSLRQPVSFGVTTTLDSMTDIQTLSKIREEASFDRADLFSGGSIITAPGGYGTQFGIPIPTLDNEDQAGPFIAARVKEGSDYVVIAYDDGFSSGKRWPEHSYSTLHTLIEMTHKQKKVAVVHVGSLRESMEALHAGADIITPIFRGAATDPTFAPTAAKQKTFVIPLLAALENMCGIAQSTDILKDAKLEPYFSAADKTRLAEKQAVKANCNGSLEAFGQLRRARVTMLAGSNAGEPGAIPGASLHRELEILVKSGLSPIEALEAATSSPAKAFHLDDRGEIAKGKRADFFLVTGDPTRNILATRDIVSVWKQGVMVDRANYKSQLKR